MRLARKYRNEPTYVDGLRFDSKAEARRYGELRILQFDRQISDLRCQVPFTLFGKRGGKVCEYRADFTYTERGKEVVEDVKGVATRAFGIKAKLFRDNYPNIELRVVR
jgi:uncharacterized protein DUF1064